MSLKNSLTFIRSLAMLKFPRVLVVLYRMKGNNLQFLLIKSKHSNAVTFPSGTLSFGESYESAAYRELYEETEIRRVNLRLITIEHYFSYNNLFLKPRSIQKVFLAPYYGKISAGVDNDVEWVRWFGEAEVCDVLTYKELKRTFKKMRRLLSHLL